MRIIISLLLTGFLGFSAIAENAQAVKEWTFLVFLNGHNNLDTFGDLNVNQMKQVGSSSNLNIVVQWASLKHGNTKRVYVDRGNARVVQDLGRRADMGDYRELVEFVRWAKQNYPAKRYFIDIWNHGMGWKRRGALTRNISSDDLSGNEIRTEQMAPMLNEISQILGQKVDVLGADACLMAMAEVASEVSPYVHAYASSQDLEPGEGWAYNTFLTWWVANPTASATEVGVGLTNSFFNAYEPGGEYSDQDVTFSVLDLTKWDVFSTAWSQFSQEIKRTAPQARAQLTGAIRATRYFDDPSYGDIGDFLNRVQTAYEAANVQYSSQAFQAVRGALDELVVISKADTDASGLSVWVPQSYDWGSHRARYSALDFAKDTGWHEALGAIYP